MGWEPGSNGDGKSTGGGRGEGQETGYPRGQEPEETGNKFCNIV